MTVELARRLLAAGVVTDDLLERALVMHFSTRSALPVVLVRDLHVRSESVDQVIATAPVPFVKNVVPCPEAGRKLPPGLMSTLAAFPVRTDRHTGTVDVVFADPFEPAYVDELTYHLAAPIRPLRTSIVVILRAIETLVARSESGTPLTPPNGLAPRESHRSLSSPPTPGPTEHPIDVRTAPWPSSSALLATSAGSEAAQHGGPTNNNLSSQNSPWGTLPGPYLSAIERAHDRDELISALLSAATAVARRVVLLVVRRDHLQGWTSSENLGGSASLRSLRISMEGCQPLEHLMEDGWFVRPPRSHCCLSPLVRFMHSTDGDLFLFVISAVARPTLVMAAAQLSNVTVGTRNLESLARSASSTLTRLVLARKRHR